MTVKKSPYVIFAVLAFASVSSQADTIISESFSGYPDDALISSSPAGPALGLTGDWYLDAENFFYVNMTEADLAAGTGKAVYDMPFDDNGARTAQRFTLGNPVLLANDGDIFYASFQAFPPRPSGHMTFTLMLERSDGGGQTDVSFGMTDGAFIVGNGGEDVDVSAGTPAATEMLIVLRVEYGDASTGPDDDELVTLWVNPADESSTPVIDRAPLGLLNRGGARMDSVTIRGAQMAGQPALFDNLMVGFNFEDVTHIPQTGELSNDLGVNGLFYDPNNPGHGLTFIVHAHGLTVFYLGHTDSGERLWLMSLNHQGDLEFNTPIELEMLEVEGGVFGQPELPATSWGSLTVTLADCNSGHASFSGIDGELEMAFVRLSYMPGIYCQ